MAENKTRLDIAIFEQGFTESRAKAGALIMAGQVYVNGQKALKSGITVKATDKIEVSGMDIGASTGGFSDCMLQNGAQKVYAVDVGYGQLAWKLRTDDRVINMERTNFRYLTEDDIDSPLDFASVDVLKNHLACIILLIENGRRSSLFNQTAV